MGWQKRLTFAGVLLSCLLIASCSGLKPSSRTAPGEPLVAARQTLFPDIPVPRSFRLCSDRSWQYTREGLRLCSHLYEGRALVLDVADFYRDQMPVSNWKLLSEYFDFGVKVLRFQKGNEFCMVRIASPGKKTTLRVRLDRSGSR